MKNLLLAFAIIILMGWIFYCTNTDGPRIEKDLMERVSGNLLEVSEGFRSIKVSADVRNITLVGEVESQSDIDKVIDLTKNVYGVKTVKSLLTVTPKPVVKLDYQTGIQLDAKRIVLSGMVPDKESKLAYINIAKELYGDREVIDRLVVQSGAPHQWSEVMSSLLKQMQSFLRGNAVLLNSTIAISGDVDTQEKSNFAISSLISSLGDEFRLNPRINVITPRATTVKADEIKQQALNCQKEFEEVLSSAEIKFKTNSDEIQTESFPLLDSLVQIAGKCPSASMEVAGHTDSQGSESYNQQLSEKRASSVVRYLVSKGVITKRLSSSGYGESQPIADNSTAIGRAKNRRIELKVMER